MARATRASRGARHMHKIRAMGEYAARIAVFVCPYDHRALALTHGHNLPEMEERHAPDETPAIAPNRHPWPDAAAAAGRNQRQGAALFGPSANHEHARDLHLGRQQFMDLPQLRPGWERPLGRKPPKTEPNRGGMVGDPGIEPGLSRLGGVTVRCHTL
jgi:hypothetical protein